MPYVLLSDEPIDDGVRRVLRELLTEAAARAATTERADLHNDVHELRKSLKKARAVLKLVRRQVPNYLDYKATYRDLGRQLSASRDAAAIIEGLDLVGAELASHTSSKTVARVRRALMERRDAVAPAADEQLRAMAGELRAAAEHVALMEIDTTGDPMQAGLEREYRRGRRLASFLKASSEAEEFHAWRKRAKEHRYHLELLLAAETDGSPMHALTDLLGRSQDVTVLLTSLAELEMGKELNAPLRRMREQLQTAALELGGDVYDRLPARMSEDVFAVWRRTTGSDAL